jgi:hypothetical protein
MESGRYGSISVITLQNQSEKKNVNIRHSNGKMLEERHGHGRDSRRDWNREMSH